MPHILIRIVLLSPVLALAPLGIAAEVGSERFAISLGAFITDRDTKTRVDSSSLGRGTTIVLEDDLGLDSSQTVFRADGHFGIAERHRIDFSLFDLSRDSSLAIDQDIQFQDDIFLVDTTVNSEFDMNIYKVEYTYLVWSEERGFLGVGAGLHVGDLDISLDAPSAGQFQESSLTAPLPVVGVRGAYRLAPRWTLNGAAEYFAIEYNKIDGRLVDVFLGLDYKFADKLALGVAYNLVDIDVDAERSEFSGELDWRYNGFLLYFKFTFGSIDKTAAT